MTPGTIVAVSSPPGRSRRGLVRLSGPDARRIAESLLDRPLPSPRQLGVGRLSAWNLPCLVACFQGPRSHTGEDVVEIQLPGNAALLQRVMHAVLAASGGGARLAEPGEFTFRAFSSGKTGLTEAEGVAATIAAVSDGQLRAATMLRRGALGAWAGQLVDELTTLSALTEAGIDFTDQEDVTPITPATLDEGLSAVEVKLRELLSHSRPWSELESLAWVVLAGKPSAGKSTLFNALLGRRRAVVDAQPGTTRDVICEPMTLGDREVMLVDIAGLDDARNRLDEQVQRLARQALDRADLILNVLDPTRGDEAAHEGLNVHTKADLAPPDLAPPPGRPARDGTDEPGRGDLRLSAVTGQGLEELRRAIARRLSDRAATVSGQAMALQPRHESDLREALGHLVEARRLLKPQRDASAIAQGELVAGCLRAALDALGGLGGQTTSEDVIGRIFATFCVGK